MSATIAWVRGVLYLLLRPKRLAAMIGWLIAGTLYVWVAAVKAVPRVQKRKAAFREAWRLRDRERKAGH